jgi:heptosyltransferase-2
MVNYQNILVIQTAFIGDAILASSLIEKLHNYFPQSQLSILVRKGNEGLYNNHPFLKSVLVWDKQNNKSKNILNLLFQIRKNKYDCVINCHRFASSGFLTAFSGAKHKAGYKQNPFSFLFDTRIKHSLLEGFHEIDRYNQLIEDFTNSKVFKPKLYPSQNDKEFVKEYINTNYVCMAPGSAWLTKQLPVLKWVELCNKTPHETTIYLIGAAHEKSLAEEIKKGTSHPNTINLCGQFNLLQTMALISAAQMNYVNDSAPLHLASASNAPVTAFFLSTIPTFGFGPLSDKNVVKEVRTLKCRPCGDHGFRACPEKHFKCGYDMVI